MLHESTKGAALSPSVYLCFPPSLPPGAKNSKNCKSTIIITITLPWLGHGHGARGRLGMLSTCCQLLLSACRFPFAAQRLQHLTFVWPNPTHIQQCVVECHAPIFCRPVVCAVCNLITFELRNRTKFAWAEKQSKADPAGQNKTEEVQAGQQHTQSCFKGSECRASLKFIIHKLNFMPAVWDLQIQFCICIWICCGILACCSLPFHLHYRLMPAEFLILVTRNEKQQQNLHKVPRA